ncbi:hypothetical protein F2P81_008306 [Scophthalmus maximus]|uniref:Uncharacterized protein n=1 Tax=Scophthalmus maximus TaxID=52904 RepID=A0A6A4TAW8_SCOMX|nr:hypothetical protein F2P81_008306 [Scophthalmus maximus]
MAARAAVSQNDVSRHLTPARTDYVMRCRRRQGGSQDRFLTERSLWFCVNHVRVGEKIFRVATRFVLKSKRDIRTHLRKTTFWVCEFDIAQPYCSFTAQE